MGSFFFRSLTFPVPPQDRKQSNVENKQSTAGLITIALRLISLSGFCNEKWRKDGFPRRGSRGGQTGKEENATGQFLRMELPEMYQMCRPGNLLSPSEHQTIYYHKLTN